MQTDSEGNFIPYIDNIGPSNDIEVIKLRLGLNAQLHTKLGKAKLNIAPAVKDATNDFMKYSYATISAIIKSSKTELIEAGIDPSMPVWGDYQASVLTDTETGYAIHSWAILPTTNDPQVRGSNQTYNRRYNLTGELMLETEDDDGAHASKVSKIVQQGTKSRKATKTHAQKVIDRGKEIKAKYPDGANSIRDLLIDHGYLNEEGLMSDNPPKSNKVIMNRLDDLYDNLHVASTES